MRIKSKYRQLMDVTSKFIDGKKTKHCVRGERMMQMESEAEAVMGGEKMKRKWEARKEEGGCREKQKREIKGH